MFIIFYILSTFIVVLYRSFLALVIYNVATCNKHISLLKRWLGWDRMRLRSGVRIWPSKDLVQSCLVSVIATGASSRQVRQVRCINKNPVNRQGAWLIGRIWLSAEFCAPIQNHTESIVASQSIPKPQTRVFRRFYICLPHVYIILHMFTIFDYIWLGFAARHHVWPSWPSSSSESCSSAAAGGVLGVCQATEHDIGKADARDDQKPCGKTSHGRCAKDSIWSWLLSRSHSLQKRWEWNDQKRNWKFAQSEGDLGDRSYRWHISRDGFSFGFSMFSCLDSRHRWRSCRFRVSFSGERDSLGGDQPRRGLFLRQRVASARQLRLVSRLGHQRLKQTLEQLRLEKREAKMWTWLEHGEFPILSRYQQDHNR